MQIQNNFVQIKNINTSYLSNLKLGEKISFNIIKSFGNGEYLINTKNKSIKVKSFIPLENVKHLIVSEKVGKTLVLKPEILNTEYNISNLLSGFKYLSQINDPIIHRIVSIFIKKNIKVDEEKVVKLYNSLKKIGNSSDISEGLLRFLVNLMEDKINFDSNVVELLIRYVNKLNNKKEKNKKRIENKELSENIKEEFSKEEIKVLKDTIKSVSNVLDKSKKHGGQYYLLPFLVEDQVFYSELKIFCETNDSNEKIYGFASNIEFSTGEIKIRANFIKDFLYLKLFFENESFMEFCKKENLEQELKAQSISFLPMSKITENEEVLFSDIYLKDDAVCF